MVDALDVDLRRVGELGDDLLVDLGRLRDVDTIYWSELSNCWLVTGHDEIIEGYSGKLPLSSRQFPEVFDPIMADEDRKKLIPNTLRYVTTWITNTDDADHRRLRKLYMKGFSKNVVEDLRPFVRLRVSELLDRIQPGKIVEFNEEIARQLPGSVILRLLGMSDDYLPRLQGWASATVTALASNQPKAEWLIDFESVVNDMTEVFEIELEARRKERRSDLIADLLYASEDGETLSHDELIGALQQIIIAGHESTMSSISLAVAALAKNPAKWEYLATHPEEVPQATLELMRYSAMSAASARIVSQDFEWHGRQLRRGQMVMLMIAGGNRDPAAYPQPENLDFSRTNYELLTFAPGLHHCIGHLLAKMQVSEFLTALTQRFGGAELVGGDLHFMSHLIFRGVHDLNMRFFPSH